MEWNWLLQISRPVFDGFVRLEPRKWGATGTVLELSAETGKLARAITIFEGYRHGHKSRHEMADELSDMLFVLCRLVYDFKLVTRREIISVCADSVEDAFFKIHSAIDQLHFIFTDKEMIKLSLLYSYKLTMEQIDKIAGLVLWLAEHYKIDLATAHLDEMHLASTFQRLFFDKNGKKKSGNKLAKLYRRIIWAKANKLHVWRLDRL